MVTRKKDEKHKDEKLMLLKEKSSEGCDFFAVCLYSRPHCNHPL